MQTRSLLPLRLLSASLLLGLLFPAGVPLAVAATLYDQFTVTSLGETVDSKPATYYPAQKIGTGLSGTVRSIAFKAHGTDLPGKVSSLFVQIIDCGASGSYGSCSTFPAGNFGNIGITEQTGDDAMFIASSTGYSLDPSHYYFIKWFNVGDMALYGSATNAYGDSNSLAGWVSGNNFAGSLADLNIEDTAFRLCDTANNCDLVPPDLTAPALTITTGSASTSVPTILGTSDDTPDVFVELNGKNYVATPSGNAWSFVVPGIDALVDGIYSIFATSTDGVGNIGTTNRTLVIDTTIPLIDITAPASTASTSAVSIDFSATDTNLDTTTCAFDGLATSTCSNTAATTLADGTHTFTVVATDTVGNSNTAGVSFAIDTTAPTLSGTPADIVAEATDASTTVSYTLPTADGGETVTCTPASGYGFSLGSTTVTCSAQDALGNATSSSFVVGVQDTTAPTITLSGDASMTLIVGATFSDPGATATDLGTSSPVNASGSVDTATVGTYFIVYTATDTSGNTASSTRTVTVTNPPPSGGGGSNGPPVGNPSQGLPQGVVLGTQTNAVQHAAPKAIEVIKSIMPPVKLTPPGQAKKQSSLEIPTLAFAPAAPAPAPVAQDPWEKVPSLTAAAAQSGSSVPPWLPFAAGAFFILAVSYLYLKRQ